MKGKRRIVPRCYFNRNILYLLQIYERNCFKQWVTVNCTTNRDAAEKWKSREHFS
jgi:hypothetical protein